MHYIYALHNKSVDRLYVGETSDISRRVNEHNRPESNKGHFTSKYPGIWELIYQEELPNRKEALKREKELKSHRGRDFLRGLINPE